MKEIDEAKNVPIKPVGKSFTPTMVSWLIAILVGIILPLFSQDLVANQISNLSSPLPATLDEVASIPTSSTMLLASLALFTLSCLYVTAIGFQIFFIAKIQKILTIWSFTITVMGPIFIWLILPYIILFTSGR